MKKVKGYEITDEIPKEGDTVVCVQRNNFNYGKTEIVTKQQAELGTVDKKWKVVKK